MSTVPYFSGVQHYDDPATSKVYAFDWYQVTHGVVPQAFAQCVPRPSPCHVWVDGGWAEDAALAAIAHDEKKGAARAERNARLAACDWTQGRDIADATVTLWTPYRQLLRDIPAQAGFPDTIDWPTTPV